VLRGGGRRKLGKAGAETRGGGAAAVCAVDTLGWTAYEDPPAAAVVDVADAIEVRSKCRLGRLLAAQVSLSVLYAPMYEHSI
jgi:hypothetical protein